jgi:Raf kinase inhibitor-like YbhB/YbcL family protein
MILAALAFTLASNTFKPDSRMPATTEYDRSGCSGQNVSPELHWSGAPAKTKSFALIVHDPDAPAAGGWYHWVVYNLPASSHSLAAGAKLAASQLGTTSWGDAGYGGPCPPPGAPHHYNFTLYALDVPKFPSDSLSAAQAEAFAARHSIAKATLTGLFGR